MDNTPSKGFILFQPGCNPNISVRRSQAEFRRHFTRMEGRAIDEARTRFLATPEGDGLKLSVLGVSRSGGKVVLDVDGLQYSVLRGVLEANGPNQAFARLLELRIRPLVSKNLIVTADGFLVYSINRSNGKPPVNTPLNGYVESDLLSGPSPDISLLRRNALKELFEEFHLTGASAAFTVHSIHFEPILNISCSVNAFGSIVLPVTFATLAESHKLARDAHENPELGKIRNVPGEILDFASNQAESLSLLLRIYAGRIFGVNP